MAGVEGRVALVTGGGRGIGRATAELMASRGSKVICVARSRQELADVGLEYSVADLGSSEGCARAVAEADQRLGPIEILVCNHGIGSAHEQVVWEQQPDVWSETMRVNLDGPFHLSRLVLPGMIQRQFGRIVYTSSSPASYPFGRFPPPSKKVHIDVRLDEVVLRTLEKEPSQRYQRASELQSDVESISTGGHVTADLHEESSQRPMRRQDYEYRSPVTLFGLPLVHIASIRDPEGKRMRVATGVIAIGDVAIGGVAIGAFSFGVIRWAASASA